jgi:pyridoxine 5-phosphate synthase
MTNLSVNLNKVATLRNQRDLDIPNVLHAAKLCLDSGADGITVHPRPDQRHIRPCDVYDLAKVLKGYPNAEFNLEGNPFEGQFLEFVRDVKPTQCTLVPDEPSQRTSDHGWSMSPNEMERLTPIVRDLKQLGCRVALFVDATLESMQSIVKLGADRVELYTEPYAADFAAKIPDPAQRFAEAARRASSAGLAVNAGHDLSLLNLPLFLATVPNVSEVSIGHALIADALEYGLRETTRKYVAICRKSR